MGKSKEKKQQSTPRINESMLRVSFLEQAAQLLATKSESKNDGLSLLSKNYMDELKEVRFVQQILLDKTVHRNFCRKCKRIWVPNATGDNGMMIKITKKHVFRWCTDCEAVTRFVRNGNYKSRNEKLEPVDSQ